MNERPFATVRITPLPRIASGAYRVEVVCQAFEGRLTIVPGSLHPGLAATIMIATYGHESNCGECNTRPVRKMGEQLIRDFAGGFREASRRVHAEEVELPYAYVNVGRLWRWVVWRDRRQYSNVTDDDVVATGLAPNLRDAAHAARLAGGGREGDKDAARLIHRREMNRRRSIRKSSSSDPNPISYVYRVHNHSRVACKPNCQIGPVAYRIIKRTKKRVYVDTVSDEKRSTHDIYDVRSFILDRATLERDGAARGGVFPWRGWWFTNADSIPTRSVLIDIPDCIVALGLSWPTSEQEVRQAYRRLSRERHPDAGGTHGAFIELNRSYEAALRLTRAGL
jgi:hypothetical protein